MKLNWNNPKEIANGKYVNPSYTRFWDLWNNKKDEIKEKGFSIKI